MIVRKPYAFLIKNFRLIHLFMLIFSSYLLIQSNLLFKFFNNYVDTRQVVSTGSLASQYITPSMYIFSLLLIIFSFIIFILLNQKDKPKLLYITMMIFYFALIIFSIVSSLTITNIELEGINPQIARIIRDISLISFLIQIGYDVLILVRTIGFDIKKFHFGEDLQSLDIDISDSEEIELTSGIDIDRLVRKFKMKKEDLKAFFLENKVIIISILVILILIIPGYFFVKDHYSNKLYLEGETIKLNDYTLKINSSYYTKYDYKGEKLLEGENSYLIVNFNISNYSDEEISIDLSDIKLEVNDEIYSTNITLYDHFIDLGNGYYNQKISNSESKSYIVIFIISDDDIKEEIKLRYTEDLSYSNREALATYKRIKLEPNYLDEMVYKDSVKLNEELDLTGSLLKNSNILFSNYSIKEKFSYESEDLTKYVTNNNGYVMKLSYVFNLDDDINFITDLTDFATKYFLLVYTYNDVEYKTYITNITPLTYESKDLYLAVSENVKNSTGIKIVINIRNINYTYIIK